MPGGIHIPSNDPATSGGAAHDLLSATHTDTLPASAVRGDLLVANSTPAWSRKAIGGNGTFLASDGTDPSWRVLAAGDVPNLAASKITSGTFGVARGGTGLSTIAADRILYTSAIDTLAATAITAFGRSLIDDADAAAGRTTLGLVIGTNVQAYDADLTALAGIAGVNGDIIIRSGGAWTRLAKGSDTEVLTLAAGLPSWAAPSSGADHDLGSATHTDVATFSVVRGDLLYGDSTPQWNRLVVGAAGRFLRSDGTDPSWAQIAAADVASGTFADARIAQSNVTQHEAAIDHDALTNSVADEHVAHASVTLTAGDGLTGGGTIAASRTFNFNLSGLVALGAPSAADELAIYQSGVSQKKITFANLEAGVNHDALAGFVAEEHIRWDLTGAEDVHVDRIPDLSATYQPLDSDLTALAGLAGVNGDIIIRSGGAWARLAKGSDGEVLKLASGLPSWATEGGGSGPFGSAAGVITKTTAGDILRLQTSGADEIPLDIQRGTDSSPTAELVRFRNAANDTTLGYVSAAGRFYYGTSPSPVVKNGTADFGTGDLAQNIDLGLRTDANDQSLQANIGGNVYAFRPQEHEILLFIPGAISADDESLWFPIKFPGDTARDFEVVAVYAYFLTTDGTTATTIKIQECTQTNIDGTPSWVDLLTVDLTIDANEKSSYTAATAATIDGTKSLAQGDHLKAKVSTAGTAGEDLVVAVTIREKKVN